MRSAIAIALVLSGACAENKLTASSPSCSSLAFAAFSAARELPIANVRAVPKPGALFRTSPYLAYGFHSRRVAEPNTLAIERIIGGWATVRVEACEACELILFVNTRDLELVTKRDLLLVGKPGQLVAGIWMKSGTPMPYPGGLVATVATAWGNSEVRARDLGHAYEPSRFSQPGGKRLRLTRSAKLMTQPCEPGSLVAHVEAGTEVHEMLAGGDGGNYKLVAIHEREFVLVGYLESSLLTPEPDEAATAATEQESVARPRSEATLLELPPGVCLFAGTTGEVVGRVTEVAKFSYRPTPLAQYTSVEVVTNVGTVEVLVMKDETSSSGWKTCR